MPTTPLSGRLPALALLAALAAGCTAADAPAPPGSAADARPEQAALDAFLAGAPGFAVAPDATFAFLESYRDDPDYGDPSFTPYRVVGDFDGDGLDDVAVLVIDADRADDGEAPMQVLVFEAAGGHRLAHAEPISLTLGQGYVTVRDGVLAVAEAETDFAIELVPDGDRYVGRDVSG